MLANFKKAHIWRNLGVQPQLQTVTAIIPQCTDKDAISGWLTVPASNSRLSELELMSWEKEGWVTVQEQGEW